LPGGETVVEAPVLPAPRVEDEPLTWRITDGPWFDNQVATLDIDGRRMAFRLEKAVGPAEGPVRLEEIASRPLA